MVSVFFVASAMNSLLLVVVVHAEAAATLMDECLTELGTDVPQWRTDQFVCRVSQ
jgi:hypothetical protein